MIPLIAKGTMERSREVWETELPALMARYQQGEADAIDELVRRLSPRLLGYLASSGESPSDAEDLLQECWIRIHRSRHTYRCPESVLPWVFAIARHTRLDGYRRRRRRESREVLFANPPEDVSHTQDATAMEREQFFQLLDDLPESQREVILMLKVSGMSLEEVARATSSTVGAIKQKAHRAYARLRMILKDGQ